MGAPAWETDGVLTIVTALPWEAARFAARLRGARRVDRVEQPLKRLGVGARHHGERVESGEYKLLVFLRQVDVRDRHGCFAAA